MLAIQNGCPHAWYGQMAAARSTFNQDFEKFFNDAGAAIKKAAAQVEQDFRNFLDSIQRRGRELPHIPEYVRRHIATLLQIEVCEVQRPKGVPDPQLLARSAGGTTIRRKRPRRSNS